MLTLGCATTVDKWSTWRSSIMSRRRVIVALLPPCIPAFYPSGSIIRTFIGPVGSRQPRLQSKAFAMNTLTMRLSPKSLQSNCYIIGSQCNTPLIIWTQQQPNWGKIWEREGHEADSGSGRAGVRGNISIWHQSLTQTRDLRTCFALFYPQRSRSVEISRARHSILSQ